MPVSRSSGINRSFALLLLGVVLATVLAGCGGGGEKAGQPVSTDTTTTTQGASTTPPKVVLAKPAYEKTMRRLGRTLAVAVGQIFPLEEGKPGSETEREAVAKLERTRAVVTKVRRSLAAITAPQPVRADHQRLIRSLVGLRDELDVLIRVMVQGGTKPIGSYARFSSLQTIARTVKEIERKGYAIGK